MYIIIIIIKLFDIGTVWVFKAYRIATAAVHSTSSGDDLCSMINAAIIVHYFIA